MFRSFLKALTARGFPAYDFHCDRRGWSPASIVESKKNFFWALCSSISMSACPSSSLIPFFFFPMTIVWVSLLDCCLAALFHFLHPILLFSGLFGWSGCQNSLVGVLIICSVGHSSTFCFCDARFCTSDCSLVFFRFFRGLISVLSVGVFLSPCDVHFCPYCILPRIEPHPRPNLMMFLLFLPLLFLTAWSFLDFALLMDSLAHSLAQVFVVPSHKPLLVFCPQ